jgi:hypothetical protein
VTPDQAADILIRLEAGWPAEIWRSSTVDTWYGLLLELDHNDTYDAVTELIKSSEHRPSFAVVRARVEQMNIRRNPTPATKPCIRCKHAPAEQNRTRCGPCQAELENEIAHGQRSPAMAAAVQAARRRGDDAQ